MASHFFSVIAFITYKIIPDIFGALLCILSLEGLYRANVRPDNIFSDGLFWVSFLLSVPISLWIFFKLIRNKVNCNLKEYFALNKVEIKVCLFWLLLLTLYIVLVTIIFYYSSLPINTMSFVCFSYYILPLVFLSIVIIIPLFEELLIRGFIFKYILGTRIGVIGSVIITSIIWSVLHLQYGIIAKCILLGFGVILALARFYSKSIYLPIIMHISWNLLSFLFNTKILFE